MKKYMKSYHVFLANGPEQILMYVIYPVIMLFGIWLISIMVRMIYVNMNMPDAMVNAPVIGSFMTVIELVLDILLFGGLLSKDTNKLEYLKISKRGMDVLKKGVIVDKIRRIVMIGVYLCVGYAFSHKGVSIWQILSLAMLLGGIIELSLLVTRRSSSMVVLVAVGMLANILGIGASAAAFALPGLLFPIFALLYGGIAVASHRLIMNKMKKSFLDEVEVV